MVKFIYSRLCCKFLSKEEASFERGQQKITFEKDMGEGIIPMAEYDFNFIYDEKDGTYFVSLFEVDKYGIMEIILQNVLEDKKNERIHILSHTDSYKEEDMQYFTIGSLYKLNIIRR